ncbi:hypothetical protein GYMLUDRAFT_916253 [Collybiopsis luxurians FD-317 M1]|uniref:Uncharacterized protein n=1 Tax=Collybiopsis luxurians FD-317 M1 TaxID=944289 RepID=A0A0D0BWW8_9AGAR|nr:hypothetical protein GYMLUDRAFT_916253 [Collybiopsis luxurians FD-317 M1]
MTYPKLHLGSLALTPLAVVIFLMLDSKSGWSWWGLRLLHLLRCLRLRSCFLLITCGYLVCTTAPRSTSTIAYFVYVHADALGNRSEIASETEVSSYSSFGHTQYFYLILTINIYASFVDLQVFGMIFRPR